jgi:hypothetical protein
MCLFVFTLQLTPSLRPAGLSRRIEHCRPSRPSRPLWPARSVGVLNEVHQLDMSTPSQREFLVTPGSAVTLTNTGDIPLLVYCVFPFDLDAPLSTAEIGRLVQGHAGHGAGCGC